MLTTYGVIGTGSTSKNVIEDALNELGEDNDFLLFGSHKLSASEERVLDWVTDHEVAYTVVHDGKTAASIMETAMKFVASKQLTSDFFLRELQKRKGTLLLLWDDDRAEEMEEIVFAATDLRIPIKDLTNGLTPIVVEGDEEPAEAAAPAPVEVVEIEPFSRKELEDMPITVLRKNAKNHGIDSTGMSKAQLVDALLGEDGMEEETAAEEPAVSATIPAVTYTAPKRAMVETDDEKDCMATIVLPNGTIVSLAITMAEAKNILGLG